MNFIVFEVLFERQVKAVLPGDSFVQLFTSLKDLDKVWFSSLPCSSDYVDRFIVELPHEPFAQEQVLELIRVNIEEYVDQYEEFRLIEDRFDRVEHLEEAVVNQFELPTASPQTHLEVGKNFCRLGFLEDAWKEFVRALDVDPRSGETYAYLQSVGRIMGWLPEVADIMQRSLPSNREDAVFLHIYGAVLSELGRSSQALAILKQSIRLDPSNSAVYANLARVLYKLENNEAALEAALQSWSLEEEQSDVALLLGQLYCERGEYQEAEHWLNQCQRMVGRHDKLALLFSFVYLAQNRVTAAVDLLLPLFHGEDADFHFSAAFGLARAYSLQGNVQATRQWAEECLRRDNGFAPAHLLLAKAFRVEGRQSDAIEHLDSAYLLDSSLEQDYVCEKARLLIDVDEILDARELLQDYRLDQKQEWWSLWARCESCLGHHREAVSALQAALSLNPSVSALWCDLAVEFEELGELEEALESAKKAIDCDAECWEAYRLLAWYYRAEGKLSVSELLLSQLVESNNALPEDWELLGEVAFRLGSLKSAEEFLTKALVELGQRSASVELLLAEIYLATGRAREACELIVYYQESTVSPSVSRWCERLLSQVAEKTLIQESGSLLPDLATSTTLTHEQGFVRRRRANETNQEQEEKEA